MIHAVAVVSGGMDSTVLAYGLRTGRVTADTGDRVTSVPGRIPAVDELTIVTVDYGQRHVKEIDHARRTAAALTAEHVVVDLRSVTDALTGSALTDPMVDVPDGHYAQETMKATVVPNRNAILASVAYAVGVARGSVVVALGMHAGDHAIYPDCRPEFVDALGVALRVGNTWGPADHAPYLVAPFIGMTKAQIASLGHTLGVPWADTWSCYKGGPVHCGRCGTDVERREAMHLAGIDDPTEYEDPDYWRTVTEARA